MRFRGAACAGSLVAGLVLVGSHTAVSGPLIDNVFSVWGDDMVVEMCDVGAVGIGFYAYGEVTPGWNPDSGHIADILFYVPFPTKASRDDTKVSVTGASFSVLNFRIDNESVTGNIPIEKCSVTCSVNTRNMAGAVSLRCSGNSLPSGLTASDAAIVQAEFKRTKTARFKVDRTGKWSLSVKFRATVQE